MRVAGLGQPAAGDDGVGLAVVEQLRAQGLPGAELISLRDAAPLVDLLDGQPLLLIDALVSEESPGTLRWLQASELGRAPLWSTHGMGVPDAIGLAEAIHGPDAARGLAVLAICIAPPTVLSMVLSDSVAAAVPAAVAAVRHYLTRRGIAPGIRSPYA